jgi:hypothetical protein
MSARPGGITGQHDWGSGCVTFSMGAPRAASAAMEKLVWRDQRLGFVAEDVGGPYVLMVRTFLLSSH